MISGLDSNGKPISFNGSWTEIEREKLTDAYFQSSSGIVDQGFNGWSVGSDEDISAINYFAIVVGYSTINSGSTVGVQSVSLVPGKIATIPAPQTFQEVLKDCEYYYEKSYETSTPIGTATYIGSISAPITNSLYYSVGSISTYHQDVYECGFQLIYKSKKASLPHINFYSPTSPTLPSPGFGINIEGRISGTTLPPPSSGTNPAIISSNDYVTYQKSTTNASFSNTFLSKIMTFAGSDLEEGITFSIVFQYVLDSRLGVPS